MNTNCHCEASVLLTSLRRRFAQLEDTVARLERRNAELLTEANANQKLADKYKKHAEVIANELREEHDWASAYINLRDKVDKGNAKNNIQSEASPFNLQVAR